jgi:hypothetical protein
MSIQKHRFDHSELFRNASIGLIVLHPFSKTSVRITHFWEKLEKASTNSLGLKEGDIHRNTVLQSVIHDSVKSVMHTHTKSGAQNSRINASEQ